MSEEKKKRVEEEVKEVKAEAKAEFKEAKEEVKAGVRTFSEQLEVCRQGIGRQGAGTHQGRQRP